MDKRRILLAEDEPSIRKMTTLRLEFEGYEVIAAADGDEAVRQAQAQLPIHLILLDIKLPKRNGYEICEFLKRQPATAGIPVIIFTASESESQRLADRCIEVGASGWIKKPFRTQELLDKIHHVLGENAIGEGGRDGD